MTPAGIGRKVELCATTLPRSEPTTVARKPSLSPCVKTATNTIRPRPIISAAAVRAVRAGFRIAFSRARRPVVPATFSSGQPSTRVTGATTKRASIATATNTSSAPTPMPRSRLETDPEPENPCTIRSTPTRPMTTAKAGVQRAKRPRGSTAPSRSAAIGGIFVARRAGPIDASIVTPTPTISASTTVRTASDGAVVGMPMPKARNAALMPAATR